MPGKHEHTARLFITLHSALLPQGDGIHGDAGGSGLTSCFTH